jgi:hypothetical protein
LTACRSQTFILPPARRDTPQEVQGHGHTLKNVSATSSFVSPANWNHRSARSAAHSAACTKLMAQLTGDHPQVMLDIDVYEISHNFTQKSACTFPTLSIFTTSPQPRWRAWAGQKYFVAH